jgi:hypothetical protein
MKNLMLVKINEKYFTVEPLFKNYKNTFLFVDRRLGNCTCFEHYETCQVLSEQTSDSPAFLNGTNLLKYVLNCEQHFSYFDSG